MYNNAEKLADLLKEYEQIKNHLELLCAGGNLTEYVYETIADMCNKVLEHITNRYDAIRKGVTAVMGGKILEYPAKTILKQGILQGRLESYTEMVRDGFIPAAEAAKRLGISTEEFLAYIEHK